MKATCPNDRHHRQFITCCSITQDWIVDEHGHFIELPDDPDEQVLSGPQPGNIWTCVECGAEAKVE